REQDQRRNSEPTCHGSQSEIFCEKVPQVRRVRNFLHLGLWRVVAIAHQTRTRSRSERVLVSQHLTSKRYERLLAFVGKRGADTSAVLPAFLALVAVAAAGDVGPVGLVGFLVRVILVGFGEFSIGRSREGTGGIHDASQGGGRHAGATHSAPATATV